MPHTASKTDTNRDERDLIWVLTRVPGLPVVDCAKNSNNLAPRCPMLSAIDMTAKTFFERLYLVSGLAPIGAPGQLSLYSNPPTAHYLAISPFPCKHFPMWPLFFPVSTFRNLAESQYPFYFLFLVLNPHSPRADPFQKSFHGKSDKTTDANKSATPLESCIGWRVPGLGQITWRIVLTKSD